MRAENRIHFSSSRSRVSLETTPVTFVPVSMARLLVLLILSGLMALGAGDARAQKVAVPESREQVRLTYAPVVRRAAPAVVNVYVRKRVRTGDAQTGGDPFREFFNRQFRIPRQRVQNSLGSGVIVSPDGIMVTNNHVIKGGGKDAEIKVVLADKREFPARVILKDEKTDLAVLRIDAPGVTFSSIKISNSDELEVGDIVFAIGNPFGFGQTVTSGIISALARTTLGKSDYQFFIQTDASINPGNSGGALIDINGNLVGVNTAIFSKTGASHGLGFAIPANMVQLVVQSAIQGKSVKRPWLGARLRSVTSDIAESLGLERPAGALVEQIWSKSPAQNAGLEIGDVIVSVEGKDVADPRAFRYRFGTKGVGGHVSVRLLRDNKAYDAKIALVAAPEDPPRDERSLTGRNPFSGARVANLSPALAEELSIDEGAAGVVVLKVRRGSTAGNLGLRKGDIIVSVNGASVQSTRELEDHVRQRQRRWRVSVKRGKRLLNVVIGG